MSSHLPDKDVHAGAAGTIAMDARKDDRVPSLVAWSWTLIAIATVMAWLPIVQPVIPVAEDRLIIDFYAGGYFSGVLKSLEWQGVWRILGFSLVGWAANIHALGLPLLSVLTHFLNVVVFAAAAYRLLGDFRIALGLSLVLAVLPVGYQALVWAVCYPFILASLVFWVQLYITVRYGDGVELQKPLFPLIVALTLIGALSNECLLAASLATASWFWFRDRRLTFRGVLSNMRTRYVGWAPCVGAAIYVIGYYAFRPEYVMKTPGVFNPRSLLSAYYHTLSAAAVFGAWASPLLRDLGFESWDWAMISTQFALLLPVSVLLVVGAKRLRFPERKPAELARAALTVVCLLLGASFIYAVGGGFSPESRKLYPICYLIALAAGLLFAVLPGRRALRLTVSLIAAVCIPTCWLLVGVWRFEAARSAALAQSLIQNGVPDSVEIHSDTDPYASWPYLTRSFGFRLDEGWVLDHALNRADPEYRGGLRILPEARTVLTYRHDTGWSYQERVAR